MVKRKKIITIFAIFLVTIIFIYIGNEFNKAYVAVKKAKEMFGYKKETKIIPTLEFKEEEWKCILVDSDIIYTDGAHNMIPCDLDMDGKLELVANSFRSDALIIYRNNYDLYKTSDWLRFVLDSSVGEGNPNRPVIRFIKSILKEKLLGGFTGGAHYTAIADMDGDDRNDLIVAGDFKKYDIVWYKNPEDISNITAWNKNKVYRNDSHRTYHVETGDIDGDKDQDIVFTTKTDNSVGWLRNDGPLKEWVATFVDNNCHRCFNARVADLDINGKSDIIASEDDSMNGGKLHYYVYSNNPSFKKNWIRYTIANFPAGQGVSIFEIIDIDCDNDLDIVTGNHQGDIYVLENTFPNDIYSKWNKYKINNYEADSGHNLRELDVGDIDGDGDQDIIAADEANNMIIWFENCGLTFYENWEMHVVDRSDQYLKWCHSVELEDIDGDGDLDLAVAAAGSNTFLIYFNNIKGASLEDL